MDRGQLIIEAQKKPPKELTITIVVLGRGILYGNLTQPPLPRNELENLFGANLEKDGDNVSHTYMEEEKWP